MQRKFGLTGPPTRTANISPASSRTSSSTTTFRSWPRRESQFPGQRFLGNGFLFMAILCINLIEFVHVQDLVDLTSLFQNNDGCRFILTIIDIFSKFAWTLPLRNKSGITIRDVFATVITEKSQNTSRRTKVLNFKIKILNNFVRKMGYPVICTHQTKKQKLWWVHITV